MQKKKETDEKEIIFITFTAFGDYVTMLGFMNYLLKYYDKVYLFIDNKDHSIYCKHLFYGKNIFVKNNEDLNILSKKKNMQLIINTAKNYERGKYYGYDFIKEININDFLTSYSQIIGGNDINKYYIHNNENITSNEYTLYYNIGLNKKMCNELFQINRNYNEEDKVCKKLLDHYGIGEEKFNIVHNSDINHEHINNNYINLYIENSCESPVLLLPLFQKAEEIHIIENSNGLLIYHLNYKNYIQNNKKIFFHQYYRNRSQNLINCYKEPKLNNWVFIE